MSSETVEISNLKVRGKLFDEGNQIVANKDWLQSLSLRLKNAFGKTIVYAQLELEVAVVGKMQRPLRLPMEFGRMPAAETTENLVAASVVTRSILKSNKTVTIYLQPEIYDFLLQFMQKNEIGDIEQVKIFLEFVVFDDGTGWSKGHKMRRNLTNPDQ